VTAAEVLKQELDIAAGFGTGHWAERALDALKAAGYAVVELPKPAEDVDKGYLAHFFAPANGNWVRLRWSKDIVVDGNWYRPDEARDVAAALLAAVEAAEAS
jgi:hypothetical protein